MVKYDFLSLYLRCNRHDVIVIFPLSPCFFCFVMAVYSKSVLHFSRNATLLSYIFCCNTHVVVHERINEAVMKHAVFDLSRSHSISKSCFRQNIRDGTHGLASAGDHDFVVANLDGLCCTLHRLHSSSTVLVWCKCRDRIRQPRIDPALTSRVSLCSSLEVSSDNQFIDIFMLDACSLHQCFHTFCAMYRCRDFA